MNRLSCDCCDHSKVTEAPNFANNRKVVAWLIDFLRFCCDSRNICATSVITLALCDTWILVLYSWKVDGKNLLLAP